MTCKTDNWTGCYDLGWQKIISPQSFSHPAKFSRGLIFRIIEHALEEGWIQPGQTILDPFGGVALGALPALQNGLHWVGVELESKFVELGRQNIDLWNSRFSGMPKWTGSAQLLQGDSRRLAEVVRAAGLVVSSPPYVESNQNYTSGFEYIKRQPGEEGRNGKSPGNYGSTPGQLATLPPGTPPTLALISSPPFAGNSGGRGDASRNGIDAALFDRHSGGMIGGMGDEPGNLGNLPMGSVGAVIGSPPYAESIHQGQGGTGVTSKNDKRNKDWNGWENEHAADFDGYGSAPGQLGAMVVGSPPFADSVGSDDPDKRDLIGNNKENDYDTGRTRRINIDDVSLRNEHEGDRRKGWGIGDGDTVSAQKDEGATKEPERISSKRLQDGPGQSVSTDGQLPANAGADRSQSGENQRRETLELEGRQASARVQAKDQEGEMRNLQREGEAIDSSQGPESLQQRANEPPGTLPDLSWEATCGDTDSGQKPGKADSKIKRPGGLGAQLVVGSPPFSESLASADPDKRKGLFRDDKRRNDVNLTGTYGETEGQLGGMKAGEVSAVVGSPPFEKSETGGPVPKDKYPQVGGQYFGYRQEHQGDSNGQLASDSGDTFWAAAKTIIDQCYNILPPNAYAIWVVKNYIKNGAEVDFTGQWQQLCEACGFETVHIHRAMLVKENGEQETMAAGHDTTGTTTNLLGEEVTTAGKALVNKRNRVQRKSFFRLLAEKKGAPPIDFETVLCMVKPA